MTGAHLKHGGTGRCSREPHLPPGGLEKVTRRCPDFRDFQSTLERGQASFQAPDFLRVFIERALVTVALRFWTYGWEIVVPTRQTWSRPKCPEIGDETVFLPLETERQERAGGSPALCKAGSCRARMRSGLLPQRGVGLGLVTPSAGAFPVLALPCSGWCQRDLGWSVRGWRLEPPPCILEH